MLPLKCTHDMLPGNLRAATHRVLQTRSIHSGKKPMPKQTKSIGAVQLLQTRVESATGSTNRRRLLLDELGEMLRHCLAIVGNKNATIRSRNFQNSHIVNAC